MSLRFCELHIVNATTVSFYRHLHILHHGIWQFPPPEVIKPGKQFSCIAGCTRSFGSFDGKLQYSAVLSGVEYIISASFDMPLLGDYRHHALMGTNINVRKQELPSPAHLFIIKHAAESSISSKFVVELSETREGAQYMDHLRKELLSSASRLRKDFHIAAAGPLSFSDSLTPSSVMDATPISSKSQLSDLDLRQSCSATSLRSSGRSSLTALPSSPSASFPALDSPMLGASVSSTSSYVVSSNALFSSPQRLAAMRSLPRHFPWNVKNVDWQKRLRKSHRSLRIRIVNLTRSTMFLIVNQKQPVPTLEEGLWVEFPSSDIPPNCCTEFGCQSDGLFVGTAGVCTYAIPGEPGVFHFNWDQPGMGSCRSQGQHTAGKYTVFRHVENLNEGTIFFHILDPKNPPTLQVLSARAIPYQLASPDSSSRLSLQQFEKEGFSVTPAFLFYVAGQSTRSGGIAIGGGSSSDTADVTSADVGAVSGGTDVWAAAESTDLNLVSPRAFFCSIQSSRSVPGSRSIASHSYLYLEWRIACERFRGTWGPDERVWLHAGVVGGIDKLETIMGAVVLPIRNFPPLELLDAALRPFIDEEKAEERNSVHGSDEATSRSTAQWGTKGGEAESDDARDSVALQAEGGPARTEEESDDPQGRSVADSRARLSSKLADVQMGQDLLTDVVMGGFRCLCAGLQPIVSRTMEHRFGREWLSHCMLPQGHVWRERHEVHIDLEGLLHIMTLFWNECFEAKIGDAQTLHDLQAVVIYWANQELAKFDKTFVYSFLRIGHGLLKHVGATEAAALMDKQCRCFYDGPAFRTSLSMTLSRPVSIASIAPPRSTVSCISPIQSEPSDSSPGQGESTGSRVLRQSSNSMDTAVDPRRPTGAETLSETSSSSSKPNQRRKSKTKENEAGRERRSLLQPPRRTLQSPLSHTDNTAAAANPPPPSLVVTSSSSSLETIHSQRGRVAVPRQNLEENRLALEAEAATGLSRLQLDEESQDGRLRQPNL